MFARDLLRLQPGDVDSRSAFAVLHGPSPGGDLEGASCQVTVTGATAQAS